MRPFRAPSRQALRCLRRLTNADLTVPSQTPMRYLTTSTPFRLEAQSQLTSSQPADAPSDPIPALPPIPQQAPIQTPLIGSRRRRAAIVDSSNIPFEQLPYQCFQEARKVLQADRAEKLQQIETQRARIARLQESDAELSGGEWRKQNKLASMRRTLEKLKIVADINDPMVKRRFEDGMGNMNKPIYRFLADRKWREYRRLILMQRITQMNVISDVLPHFEPVVDVKMAFGKRSVQPGDFVESKVSEKPCRLNIQSFTRGEKLVSIAIVDSDVPNVEKDGFDSRCHFLAANISISPTTPSVVLARLSKTSQVTLPWLPPTAQKGSPYHRLSLLVLAQKGNMPIDVAAASSSPLQRDRFSMRSFVARHLVSPIGVTLFRCKWDEGTAQVMQRHGVEGADIELKRRKVEPLPYKRRNPSSFR